MIPEQPAAAEEPRRRLRLPTSSFLHGNPIRDSHYVHCSARPTVLRRGRFQIPRTIDIKSSIFYSVSLHQGMRSAWNIAIMSGSREPGAGSRLLQECQKITSTQELSALCLLFREETLPLRAATSYKYNSSCSS